MRVGTREEGDFSGHLGGCFLELGRQGSFEEEDEVADEQHG